MILNHGTDINTLIENWLKSFTVFESEIMPIYDSIDNDELVNGFTNKHLDVNLYYFASYVLLIYSIENITSLKDFDTFLKDNNLDNLIDTLKCKGIDITKLSSIYNIYSPEIYPGIEAITHGIETTFEVEPDYLLDYLSDYISELDIVQSGIPEIHIGELSQQEGQCTTSIQECLVPPFMFFHETYQGDCHNVCCAT